jgi:signal transduction histidine kinase
LLVLHCERSTIPAHVGSSCPEYQGLGGVNETGAGLEPAAGERLYLDDVVSGSVARLGKVAERRRIHLAWGELSETPVYTNAHVLDQVTQILLENALQYTPEGGTVTISVTAVDGTGRLVVEDTGPGLAPEDQTSLFTPFVRGSAARRSGATGSGLGLAVAKWMVEGCGGTIATEAVEPHGARFVVHFPAGR